MITLYQRNLNYYTPVGGSSDNSYSTLQRPAQMSCFGHRANFPGMLNNRNHLYFLNVDS